MVRSFVVTFVLNLIIWLIFVSNAYFQFIFMIKFSMVNDFRDCGKQVYLGMFSSSFFLFSFFIIKSISGVFALTQNFTLI